tara:strand:- start:5560 stop:6045 length:486 start_codon:yes stop_codon:yes gene_type:complete
MQKLILSFFLVISILSANAQTPVGVKEKTDLANTTNSVIKFESKVVDYGLIDHNSDGQREFIFTNTGSEPLIIKNAKGSCGCTVPSWRKEDGSSTWEAGESGSIGVKYATNRVGKFTKTITLSTNADRRPVILTIKGEVRPPVKEETMPVRKSNGSPLEKK